MKYKIHKIMYSSSSSYHVKEMIFVSAFKKTVIKLGIYFALVTAILIVAIVPHFFNTKKQMLHHRHLRYPTDLKYILFWTESKKHKGHSLRKPEFATGQKLFINQKCPHINCYITYDKHALKDGQEFDAVVFNIDEVKKNNWNTFNMTRCTDQVYIFRSMESYEKYGICDQDFDNFFNWTWTYKLDSDIPQPFVNIHDKNGTVVGPVKKMKWIERMDSVDKFTNKLHAKNKAIAWIFTKCKLKTIHQDFIRGLKNELKGYNYSLDLYGPCAQNKCPGNRVFKCYDMLDKSYYFQLFLEDSFAEDYVTGGIVNAMTHFAIPIVYGSNHFKNFLPPGSYINAQTFDMKKLGALIDYLIKNREMYLFFLDWKNHYYYTARPKTSVCDLCTKLNRNHNGKTYTDFRKWWNPEYKDTCQRMNLVRMFNDP